MLVYPRLVSGHLFFVSRAQLRMDVFCFVLWLVDCFAAVYICVTKSNCFALLRYMIDLKKNSRHFFIQSEVKPMPIVSCSHAFSRPSCKRHVVTWTFDWFTDFLCPLWLASVITLVLHWFYDTRMKNALFSFIVIGQQNFVGFNWLIWEIWEVTLRWTSIPSRGE